MIRKGIEMKIIKIYNNNILSALKDEEEVIITGSGVGFSKKQGEDVDEDRIEKIYTFKETQHNQLQALLEKTPSIHFRLAEAIADKAEKSINITLSNQILISLTDHISYAIERKKHNQQIPNLMLSEIKTLYKREFKVGLWALKLIEANTKVVLGEDEAGYIAMHIVNATIGNERSSTSMILGFIKNIQRIIEKHYAITIDQQSLEYTRLVTHLKYLAQHIFYNENKKIEHLDHFYNILIHYNEQMQPCIEEISEFTKKEYHYEMEEYELVYLMVHMTKLTDEK